MVLTKMQNGERYSRMNLDKSAPDHFHNFDNDLGFIQEGWQGGGGGGQLCQHPVLPPPKSGEIIFLVIDR